MAEIPLETMCDFPWKEATNIYRFSFVRIAPHLYLSHQRVPAVGQRTNQTLLRFPPIIKSNPHASIDLTGQPRTRATTGHKVHSERICHFFLVEQRQDERKEKVACAPARISFNGILYANASQHGTRTCAGP